MFSGTIHFSETSVDFYRTTRRYNPEDSYFYNKLKAGPQCMHVATEYSNSGPGTAGQLPMT
jgi:hypothetical protein